MEQKILLLLAVPNIVFFSLCVCMFSVCPFCAGQSDEDYEVKGNFLTPSAAFMCLMLCQLKLKKKNLKSLKLDWIF